MIARGDGCAAGERVGEDGDERGDRSRGEAAKKIAGFDGVKLSDGCATKRLRTSTPSALWNSVLVALKEVRSLECLGAGK